MSQEEDLTGVPSERHAETMRRVEILRRYVAIENPTAEDERSFAEELGLSEHMLWRLATAWLAHRRAAALPGARGPADWTPEQRREAARDALGPVDMGAVRPTRRAVTLARVRAVGRYLSIENPSPEDQAAAADSVGVSRLHFRRLVREWIHHRNAGALPGAKPLKKFRPRRKSALGDERELIIARAISDCPPDATPGQVAAYADKLALEKGLDPFKAGTVRYRVLKARGSATKS